MIFSTLLLPVLYFAASASAQDRCPYIDGFGGLWRVDSTEMRFESTSADGCSGTVHYPAGEQADTTYSVVAEGGYNWKVTVGTTTGTLISKMYWGLTINFDDSTTGIKCPDVHGKWVTQSWSNVEDEAIVTQNGCSGTWEGSTYNGPWHYNQYAQMALDGISGAALPALSIPSKPVSGLSWLTPNTASYKRVSPAAEHAQALEILAPGVPLDCWQADGDDLTCEHDGKTYRYHPSC